MKRTPTRAQRQFEHMPLDACLCKPCRPAAVSWSECKDLYSIAKGIGVFFVEADGNAVLALAPIAPLLRLKIVSIDFLKIHKKQYCMHKKQAALQNANEFHAVQSSLVPFGQSSTDQTFISSMMMFEWADSVGIPNLATMRSGRKVMCCQLMSLLALPSKTSQS